MPTLRDRVRRLAAQEPTLRAPLKAALAITGSDADELKWAADQIDAANDILQDVVDTLDARHSGSSLADTHSDVAKVVNTIRRETSRDLDSAAKVIRRVSR